MPSERPRVSVLNGWVTLEGTVSHAFQKQLLANAIREVTGVVGDQQSDRGRTGAAGGPPAAHLPYFLSVRMKATTASMSAGVSLLCRRGSSLAVVDPLHELRVGRDGPELAARLNHHKVVFKHEGRETAPTVTPPLGALRRWSKHEG